jgi:hypothetical protein
VNQILGSYDIKFDWSYNYLWSLEDRPSTIFIFHSEDRLSLEYALVLKSQFKPYLKFSDDLRFSSFYERGDIINMIVNQFNIKEDSILTKTTLDSSHSMLGSTLSVLSERTRNIWLIIVTHDKFRINSCSGLLETIYQLKINIILISKGYDSSNDILKEATARYLAFSTYENRTEDIFSYIFCQRRVVGTLASCISY